MRSEILDYFDSEKTNTLLEGFYQSTGFVTAILDLDGNILFRSGWRQICTDFHRVNPETSMNCTISDTELANQTSENKQFNFYRCLNGLIDVQMPIIISGEHIANLYSGQFFFENPDLPFFKRQAKVYGFDENSYLEALGKVPVVSKEKAEVAMKFLLDIIQMIIQVTDEKFEQLELNEVIRKNEIILLENQVQLKQHIDNLLESQRIAHVGTWRLDLATNQVVWSEELYRMYGFDPTIPPPPYTEHMKLFSPESWEVLSKALDRTSRLGIPYELELKTVTKDGSSGWMWVRGEAIEDAAGNIVSLRGAAQDITERKKIEHEIKQNEERFQLLFNNAPLGYQSLDFDGCFIEVNQKWLDTLGYSKEEVIGKWFGDFLCPEYVDGFRQRFPIFKEQGYIYSEFEMLRKDGQRVFISFDGKVGYSADNEFKQTHCILQDITNQRKAEKALKESEERYRYLFEYSGIGIGYYSKDGIVLSYNQKALENLGGSAEDYIGKSVTELFPEEMGAMLSARFEKTVLDDQPQKFEDFVVLNTGPKWFSSILTSVKNLQGEVIGIQVAALDITDRKLAEEALLESETILLAALDSSQAGIAIADAPDGKLRYVNNAGLRISDKSEEELFKDININTYTTVWKMFHTDGTPLDEDEFPLSRAILYGETCNGEFIIRRDNSEDRYILANAVPIKDSHNNIKAGIVVFLDLTEKRLAEEDIRKQNDLFASLLKLLPVGVFMVDAADGKPLVINEMGKTLLGSGVIPEANEHNLSEVYGAYKGDTQEHYPTAEMPITLGMKGVSAHIDDMVVEHPDGTRILLEVFGTPVQDKQGKPWASLVTFMDITERKKSEVALQESEEKFRSIYEIGFDSLFLVDPGTGAILEANNAACLIYGYSHDELLRLKNTDLSAEAEQTLIATHLLKEGYHEIPLRYHKKKDGTVFPVEIRASVFDMKNRKVHLIQTHDITEQRKAQWAIRLETERYNALIESTDDWIWVVDSENFELVLFNAAFANYLKKHRNTTLKPGMTHDEVVDSSRRDLWKGYYKKAISEGRFSIDHTSIFGDKQFIVSFSPLVIDGKTVGVSVFAKDITNESRYKAELEMSNQTLSRRFKQTIDVISRIGELRDAYTAGHQKRVMALACAIAKEMGLVDEVINNIADGALIHDIGKIYIASDILNKPGRITNLEYQILQTHVDQSYDIVKEIDFPISVIEMIHQHHERLDGSGYPNKLVGDQIIIEARILAVADVVEAMTSHRPYRAALGIDVALEEILAFRGEKFDGEVVDACIRLFGEKRFVFPGS